MIMCTWLSNKCIRWLQQIMLISKDRDVSPMWVKAYHNQDNPIINIRIHNNNTLSFRHISHVGSCTRLSSPWTPSRPRDERYLQATHRSAQVHRANQNNRKGTAKREEMLIVEDITVIYTIQLSVMLHQSTNYMIHSLDKNDLSTNLIKFDCLTHGSTIGFKLSLLACALSVHIEQCLYNLLIIDFYSLNT